MSKMKIVRDGRLVAPYCNGCGCRLKVTDVGTDNYFVEHFPGSTWLTDARECRCAFIASTWTINKEQLYAN
jgi:hypothetical protein